jgi:basic amino acid/polyamine antiporter, APA family
VTSATASPTQLLSISEAVTLLVGLVVGAGLFKAPSVVATYAGDALLFVLAWILGGVASRIEALR